jgi:hypothetical protein
MSQSLLGSVHDYDLYRSPSTVYAAHVVLQTAFQNIKVRLRLATKPMTGEAYSVPPMQSCLPLMESSGMISVCTR